jgi:hypothetical protein
MQHLDEGTIHAWIDGALDSERASAVEAHVAACATCAAAVAEARGLVAGASRILAALDHVPGGVVPANPAPGATSAAALAARAHRDASARARRWRRYTWLGSAAAAAIAFVVVGSIALRQKSERGGARTLADAVSAPSRAGAFHAPGPAEVRPVVPAAPPSAAQRAGTRSGNTEARSAPPSAKRATSSAPRAFAQGNVARAAEPARDTAPAAARSEVASTADSAAASAESEDFAGRAPRYAPATTPAAAARSVPPMDAKVAQRPAQGANVAPDSILARDVVVRGRVRSNNGEPIPGASVAVGQIATFTKNDGTYVLTLPSTLVGGQAAVLQVRRIGYGPAADSVRLDGSRAITHDVTLTAAVLSLSEVVVTRNDEAPAARAQARAASPQRLPITLVRSDSVREGDRVVRRKIYEVRPGVRVTLAEAAAIADHQAPVDGRRALAPAAVSPESSAVGVNAIQWTSDDGTEYTLSGRLSIAELRKLKELLH